MACYEEKRLSALWDRIDSANDNINKMGDYLAASPITSLDPYNCSVADVSLLIRDNANNFTDERSRVLFNTGDRAAAVISSICTLDTSVLEKTRQILALTAISAMCSNLSMCSTITASFTSVSILTIWMQRKRQLTICTVRSLTVCIPQIPGSHLRKSDDTAALSLTSNCKREKMPISGI